jgi:hypothetical protein
LKKNLFIYIIISFYLYSCSLTEKTTESVYSDYPWVDPDLVLEREGIYCYNTIGRSDCFKKPRNGENNRLTGYYGPPPL